MYRCVILGSGREKSRHAKVPAKVALAVLVVHDRAAGIMPITQGMTRICGCEFSVVRIDESKLMRIELERTCLGKTRSLNIYIIATEIAHSHRVAPLPTIHVTTDLGLKGGRASKVEDWDLKQGGAGSDYAQKNSECSRAPPTRR